MYAEERPTGASRGYEDQNLTLIAQFSSWIEGKMNTLWDVILAAIIPIVQLLMFFGLIFVLSVIINIYLRRVMVPRALIHERIYFDYISEQPTATIKLHSAMQQWNYIKNELIEDTSTKRRFLKAGSNYDIHAVFTVAKSARNYDIGTSAFSLKVVDAAGETIAKSVRALVIPYQHPMSLLLESVTYFPWRATRSWNMAETVDIWVNLMPDYREPTYLLPPTDSLEITLAVPVMDLSHAYVTVMPKLYGIVYFMYYYPWFSFAAGCALISGLQILCYLSIAVVVLGMRYAFQNMSSQDPLEMQYANSRRRRAVSTARTAAASAQNSDAQYGGLDRGRASLYNSFAPDSTRPVGGVNRGMREFVSTHLPGTVVEEIVEEDDNLIDTINADLLSSRDRQSLHSLGSRSSSSGEQERTPGGALEQELQKRQREQLTRGSADTVGSGSSRQQQQQLQGLSVSYSARGGAPFEPGDWDINAATTDTVPAAKVTHAVGAGAAAGAAADLTSTTTTGRTRQPSVSFVPSPSASPEQTSAAGTSRYSNTTSTANTNTAAASSSSVVASRSRSRSSSSSNSNNTPRTWGVSSSAEQHQEEDASEGEEGEREGGEVGDEEEFGQVFQNDFFNKFFPYLRKKGSVGAKKYQKEF